MKKEYLTVLLLFTLLLPATTQTLINTSFESIDNYSVGSIHNKNSWKVTSGSGEIVKTADYIKEGFQGLKLSTTSTALQIDHTSFASNSDRKSVV